MEEYVLKFSKVRDEWRACGWIADSAGPHRVCGGYERDQLYGWHQWYYGWICFVCSCAAIAFEWLQWVSNGFRRFASFRVFFL